jgi:hypothetical protein
MNCGYESGGGSGISSTGFGGGDGPVGLDHGLPHLREDDLAVWSNKIVVAFVYVWADDINVEEGLLDELFHALQGVSISSYYMDYRYIPSRTCTSATGN